MWTTFHPKLQTTETHQVSQGECVRVCMYVSVRREQESVGENIEGGKGGEEQRGGEVGTVG